MKWVFLVLVTWSVFFGNNILIIFLFYNFDCNYCEKIKAAKSKKVALEIHHIYGLKESMGLKLQIFTYSFCFVFEYQLSCKEM